MIVIGIQILKNNPKNVGINTVKKIYRHKKKNLLKKHGYPYFPNIRVYPYVSFITPE